MEKRRRMHYLFYQWVKATQIIKNLSDPFLGIKCLNKYSRAIYIMSFPNVSKMVTKTPNNCNSLNELDLHQGLFVEILAFSYTRTRKSLNGLAQLTCLFVQYLLLMIDENDLPGGSDKN